MGLLFYVPALCSIIGFVLTILGVFAGNTPGFMEPYQIVVLNTSALGRNFVPALNQASKRGLSGVTVLPREPLANTTGRTITFQAKHKNGTEVTIDLDLDELHNSNTTKELLKRQLTLSAAEGVLASLPAASAADDMAAVLGISQFYSLHIMNMCEGTFAPNATAAGAWYNVSACTAQLTARQLNMTALLNRQLQDNFVDGGSLSRLGASQSLLDVLNRIPSIGIALAAFYIMGAVFSGLALLLTFASPITGAMFKRETRLANTGAASAATLSLFIAALVVTIAGQSTVQSINRLGKDTIGMQATLGGKFLNLTWAAFAMLLLCTLYWVNEMRVAAKPAAAAAPSKSVDDAPAEAEAK